MSLQEFRSKQLKKKVTLLIVGFAIAAALSSIPVALAQSYQPCPWGGDCTIACPPGEPDCDKGAPAFGALMQLLPIAGCLYLFAAPGSKLLMEQMKNAMKSRNR